MFYEEDDNSKNTRKLLFSILEYCTSNNLKFWMEEGYFHKFYVGGEKEFEEHVNNKNSYSAHSVEVDVNLISNGYYNMFFGRGNSQMNTSISAIPQWSYKNQKEYNELYVHVFWNNEKDVTSFFGEHWLIQDSFNLAHAMQYKIAEYPNGFSDQKVIPYNLNSNWIHFLDTIPTEKLAEWWQNSSKFDEFHKALKQNEPRRNHTFLRTLTDRICEYEISEDSKLKAAYMVMDVLPEDQHKFYAKKFPFIQTALNQAHKDSLFIQSQNEIVERVVLPIYNIYDYFKDANLEAKQYLELAIGSLTLIGASEELKKNGLISIDVIKHENYLSEKNNIIGYMTLNHTDLMDRNKLKELFLKVMESIISNEEVLKGFKENKLDDKLCKQVAESTITYWVLDHQLDNKNGTNAVKQRKPKI
jgi:hypothetical protein